MLAAQHAALVSGSWQESKGHGGGPGPREESLGTSLGLLKEGTWAGHPGIPGSWWGGGGEIQAVTWRTPAEGSPWFLWSLTRQVTLTGWAGERRRGF